SLLLFKLAKTTSRIGYFMSADDVKFRKPVMPGDTMFIHAELTKARGERLAKAKCHCVVNDAIVSEGELMFTFLDRCATCRFFRRRLSILARKSVRERLSDRIV